MITTEDIHGYLKDIFVTQQHAAKLCTATNLPSAIYKKVSKNILEKEAIITKLLSLIEQDIV